MFQPKYLISFVFLVVFSFVSPKGYSKIVDRILSIVNDEIVTLSDLQTFEKKLEEKKSEKEILSALIDETLTKQLIKKLGLSPADDEVETQISGILKNQGIGLPELIEFLKQIGMSYKDYKENIKRSMENQRLLDREIKSSISISEQEIRSYYFSDVKNKPAKKSYHVRQLFLPATPDVSKDQLLKIADQALALARNGTPFDKVVRKFSKDEAQTASGGDLGFVEEEDLIAPLRNALKKLKPGETSPPIASDAGIHLLHLAGVKDHQPPGYAEAKEGIERHLYEKRFKILLEKWLKSKREEAYIKILSARSLSSFE